MRPYVKCQLSTPFHQSNFKYFLRLHVFVTIGFVTDLTREEMVDSLYANRILERKTDKLEAALRTAGISDGILKF